MLCRCGIPCSFSDNAEAECEACLQRALQVDSTHFDAHLQVSSWSRWSARRARTSAPLTGDATALLALVSYIDLVYVDLTTGIALCLRPA